jgi:hypothetical protein
MAYADLATDTVRRVLINVKAVSAGLLAVLPLLLSPAANAEPAPDLPPPDPRGQCESPDFGGVFVVTSPTLAECQYIVSGAFYYDNYDNGLYTGTLVYRDGAKVPTERPVMPETLTIPNQVPYRVVPFPNT